MANKLRTRKLKLRIDYLVIDSNDFLKEGKDFLRCNFLKFNCRFKVLNLKILNLKSLIFIKVLTDMEKEEVKQDP